MLTGPPTEVPRNSGHPPWAAASAGAWRGLMGAYVPVALHQAAHASTTIGTAVAVANAATIAAGWAGRWVRVGWFTIALAGSIVVTGLGLAVFGVTTQAATWPRSRW
jgi:hypothetical protein